MQICACRHTPPRSGQCSTPQRQTRKFAQAEPRTVSSASVWPPPGEFAEQRSRPGGIRSQSQRNPKVNPKVGAKAELVHRQFLKHFFLKQLLGVGKSTTNQIVLAEFGRFPLQIHFWQQILRYRNRVRALPNSRLDKLALIDGFWDSNPPHRVEALSGNWRSDVRRFTDTHGQQIVYDELDCSVLTPYA